MPIGEMLDYIKIINEDNKRSEAEMRQSEIDSRGNINDVKMAGTTVQTL